MQSCADAAGALSIHMNSRNVVRYNAEQDSGALKDLMIMMMMMERRKKKPKELMWTESLMSRTYIA